LPTRAFDVLMALIEASGAVVSKDALLSRVRQGRIADQNRQSEDCRAAQEALAPTASRFPMVADGVTSLPRVACSPGTGGPVPAEALADERFLGHQTETLSSVNGSTNGAAKIYVSSGNMVYTCRAWFACLIRRRSSNLATSASCRIAANCSPKAGR
jgi:hypothetical protein